MTSVKGFSLVVTPDLSSFISLSQSEKMAEAAYKENTKTVKVHPLLLYQTFSPSLPPFLVHYCFWDIKGRTINGAAGCPTFPGRARKKERKEREREKREGVNDGEFPWKPPPSEWAATLGGSWASPNYSCLMTSQGRRRRSSRAGTINQRRLVCSQGDCWEVFKAGARALQREAAGEGMQRPCICFRHTGTREQW